MIKRKFEESRPSSFEQIFVYEIIVWSAVNGQTLEMVQAASRPRPPVVKLLVAHPHSSFDVNCCR